MINWQYYPKSDCIPEHLLSVIGVFQQYENSIKSPENELNSNQVLAILREDLVNLGFQVEKSKRAEDKIHVPVLFGLNGKLEKYFEADAFQENTGTVMEVEAGRGVTNFQFLKDLFQASVMHNVFYLVIAVRNIYRTSKDFERVIGFFDTIYASGRLKLPLKGILIVGY